MSRRFFFATAVAALVTSATLIKPPVFAARAAERYTAAAINTNNGSAGNIEITVERWSSDAERDALAVALEEKGADKLLSTLQHMHRVGYFGAPGRLSWDLHFAHKTPMPDGGERVILITDRRIGFWEQTNQPRSIDYPFTVIELRLNAAGEGEGKLSNATKIVADRKHGVTLENYELQPVQLTQVKRES